MKKIKTYFANLPIGVKTIIKINFLVYFLSVMVFALFDVVLQDYFGAYPTYSDSFNPIQVVTRLFIHQYEISHILSNTILFLIFAPFIERKFGTKLFIIIYFICGTIGYMFCNYAYYENKTTIEQLITDNGINIKDIKLSDGEIDDDYLKTLDVKKQEVVNLYHNVISKTLGSSASISGLIIIYLFFNLLNIKNIKQTVLSIIVIIWILNGFFGESEIIIIGDYAHFGGFLGGLIISLYFMYNNTLQTKNGD
jgi:membrane associated rhomboid family serine protease